MELNDLKNDPDTALIVVDVQPDFYSTGRLAVKSGEEVVPVIAALMSEFALSVLTQDSHPSPHISLASSFERKKAFDVINLKMLNEGELHSPHFSKEELEAYLKKVSNNEQTLWPDHCVVGQAGWELDPRLPLEKAGLILRKGSDPQVDSLSAFFENDGSATGLGAYLRARSIKRVVLCGLAGDICVYLSARDALRESLEVYFLEEAVRYVDPKKGRETALKDLEARGVHIL